MDISQIAHVGGVSVYTANLAEGLSKVQNLEMVYFYSSLRKTYNGNLKNVKSFRIPPSILEKLFNRWRKVGIEKFIGTVDIFHSSDWTQAPTKAKKVTTYHDLVPLIHPEWSHPKIVEVNKRRLKLVEQEVDMVICVSESTRNDLLKISNIPEKRTVVIYEGVEKQFKPQNSEDLETFRKEMNLPDEFVLAIGGVGRRRNLKRVKEASKKYNLIIAGVDISWISYEQLPLLYSSAKVLLYPSFYEGFGLPIVEAMACGVPVITSSVSSMPEVGGDAPEYVNPESVIDIENKLKLVWNDQKKRESMIKEGFLQAKKFTWEKSTEKTVEVYWSLVE